MPEQSETEESAQSQTPEYVTAEDAARVVNSAVTAQLKRALPNAVKTGLQELGLDDKIAEAIKSALPAQRPDPAQQQTEAVNTDSQNSETVRKMEAAIESLSKKLETEQAAREAAEKQRADADRERLRTTALTQLRAGLEKSVRGEMLDLLVRDLDKGQGRLTVDDDGNAFLRVKHAQFKGGPMEDTDLPIAEAVGIFIKSDEAKPFLPAPGGQVVERQRAARPGIRHVPDSGSQLDEDQMAQNAMTTLGERGLSLPDGQ